MLTQLHNWFSSSARMCVYCVWLGMGTIALLWHEMCTRIAHIIIFPRNVLCENIHTGTEVNMFTTPSCSSCSSIFHTNNYELGFFSRAHTHIPTDQPMSLVSSLKCFSTLDSRLEHILCSLVGYCIYYYYYRTSIRAVCNYISRLECAHRMQWRP